MKEYDNQVVVCPACNSSDVRKKGFHHNKSGESKQRWKCNSCGYSTIDMMMLDKEVIIENVRLEKRAQRLQDLNRIKNKSFREHGRLDNALIEFSKALTATISRTPVRRFEKIDYSDSTGTGLIQISDTHFNELVEMESNQYDFEIASRRMKHFVCKAKKYLKAMGVKKVFIAITGDLMNSDRRLDELLSMASNRANATFIGVEILKQAIEDIRLDFHVTIGCVSGNESRANPEMGFTEVVASDNYDNTIYNILYYIFKDKSDIEFIPMKNSLELVVDIEGQKILMMHGHSVKGKVEASVTQIKGRYASQGIEIAYIIFGHIHSARIGDTYGRSASLVGANAYSEKALNLESRASQNVYIFYKNGNRDGVKIDLQNIEDKGYPITKEIEAYNAKSASKLSQGKVIFQVVKI
jgi:predicted phosphodiesterase|tara:strand:+ start:17001 stop:18233 length:1233 start_codon:yes stop_codon:yes gene_type:complete